MLSERSAIPERVLDGTMTKCEGLRRLTEIQQEIEYLYMVGKETDPLSPIENEFYQELRKYDFAMREIADKGTYRIIPQYDIGKFKIDFVVLMKVNGRELKLAIECDGFDYHDNDKAKATQDKQRERQLVIGGFTVLRFSGQEINDNAKACIADVFRCLRTMAGESKCS